MDLLEVGCEGMEWIKLAQDRDRWQEIFGEINHIVIRFSKFKKG